MAKILLFTGKGGVGKTVMAASTALSLAKQEKRTIVLSTDPAHSLGDALEMNLGPEPREVRPYLWAQESDVLYNIEKHWGRVRKWLRAILTWRGVDELTAEEIAVFPGMDELASLIWISYYQEGTEEYGQYDAIIMDCAPSAESLRFLTFPEISKWWIKKILPIEKKLFPVVSPIVRRITDIPIPEKEIFEDIEDLSSQLEKISSLLTNPEITRIRLVVNPENMVIKEAQRLYTYLSLYNYPIDLVICNRVIPEDEEDLYSKEWKESQNKYLKLIEESFAPLPIRKVPRLGPEVFGLKSLEEIANFLYGKDDPAQAFFKGRIITLEQENSDYLLSLRVPFFEKGDISLLRIGEELVVRIGNQRRNIILPKVVLNREPVGAKLKEGFLRIRFKEKV